MVTCLDAMKKTLKNYCGKGVDVHAVLKKLPAPAKGWTLPGHKYTGPYNPLDKQLDYVPEIRKTLGNAPPAPPTR